MNALLAALLALTLPSSADVAPAKADRPKVLVARFSGIISPVASEFLVDAVDQANREKNDLLVIELDTPGGLDTSMRDITKAILNSDVPVAVFVSPSGARAASAGVFITMAAHVAAMAPGTNIGAAHPVMIGGESPGRAKGKDKDGKEEKAPAPDVLESKVVNDAAAYLKSIAHRRGRNESWAWEAVLQSTSTAAEDAAAAGVVDLVAKDLDALLEAIEGRKVEGLAGPIRSKGGEITRLAMTGRQKLLAAISDPNVAMILMSVGTAGILIELYSPGLIFPGVVGVLSLILAFYAFQTLSVNIAGLMLILFGMALLLLEIKVTSYGLLTIGGIGAFVLGVLMLFNQQPTSGLSVSWTVIASSVSGILAFMAAVLWMTVRLQRLKSETGREGLLGATGTAASALAPKGTVHLMGEIWKAESMEGVIPEGAEVTVAEVQGLTLRVRRKS